MGPVVSIELELETSFVRNCASDVIGSVGIWTELSIGSLSMELFASVESCSTVEGSERDREILGIETEVGGFSASDKGGKALSLCEFGETSKGGESSWGHLLFMCPAA